MSTPIVDCHTHTSFSDGTSTFEQNVADAAHAIRDAYRYAAAAGYASVAPQAHKKGRRPKAPALCPLDVSQRQPPRYACLTRSSFARSAALPLMDTLPVSST